MRCSRGMLPGRQHCAGSLGKHASVRLSMLAASLARPLGSTARPPLHTLPNIMHPSAPPVCRYEAQSAEERRLGCRHLLIRALTGRLYLAGQCPAGLGCSPSSARFTTPEHLLLSGGGSDSGQPVSLHAAAAGPRSPRAGRGCSISIRAVAAGADFAVLLTWDGAVLDTRCLASRATSPRRQQQGSSFDWSGLWRPPPGCRPVAVAAGGCWQGERKDCMAVGGFGVIAFAMRHIAGTCSTRISLPCIVPGPMCCRERQGGRPCAGGDRPAHRVGLGR